MGQSSQRLGPYCLWQCFFQSSSSFSCASISSFLFALTPSFSTSFCLFQFVDTCFKPFSCALTSPPHPFTSSNSPLSSTSVSSPCSPSTKAWSNFFSRAFPPFLSYVSSRSSTFFSSNCLSSAKVCFKFLRSQSCFSCEGLFVRFWNMNARHCNCG